MMYLEFLEDLWMCEKYSWGSAILATLYREMCRASYAGKTDIRGALILLQIWAWTRFSHIRPQNVANLAPYPVLEDTRLHAYPYGYRWSHGTRINRYVVSHNLRHYREQLDIIGEDKMVWEPCTDVIDMLPDYYLVGRAIWRARVPLIYFALVEYHYPDRVLR